MHRSASSINFDRSLALERHKSCRRVNYSSFYLLSYSPDSDWDTSSEKSLILTDDKVHHESPNIARPKTRVPKLPPISPGAKNGARTPNSCLQVTHVPSSDAVVSKLPPISPGAKSETRTPFNVQLTQVPPSEPGQNGTCYQKAAEKDSLFKQATKKDTPVAGSQSVRGKRDLIPRHPFSLTLKQPQGHVIINWSPVTSLR